MDVAMMRVPGKEGVEAIKSLSPDAKILMRQGLEEIDDSKLEAVFQVLKVFYPYLWTYASRNQINLHYLMMSEAYLQGKIDGVRQERERNKARTSAVSAQ